MKAHRFFTPCFAVAIIFCSLAVSTHAAEIDSSVALVVAVRGKAYAVTEMGKKRILSLKSAVFQNDTIETGERGRIQLMFKDSTLISLGKVSKLSVSEFKWAPEQKKGVLKTKITEGTFRIMGGAITKASPKKFKTETPSATIGIRGSMYAGVVTSDTLSVVFQGGKGIDVTNAFGTVAITKPGFGTHVALNKPPLPPVKFTGQDLEKMNKALAGNGENGEQAEEEGEPQEAGEEQPEEGEEEAPAEEEPEAQEESEAEEAAPGEESQEEPAEEEGAPPTDEEQAPTEEGEPAPGDDAPPPPEEGDAPALEDEPVPSPEGEPTPSPEGDPTPVPKGDPAPPPEGDPTPVPEPLPTPPVDPEPIPMPGPPSEPEPFPIPLPEPPPEPEPFPIPVLPIPKPPILPEPPEFPVFPDPNLKPDALPVEGIDQYFGGLAGIYTDAATGVNESIDGSVFMEVNWYNQKAMGVVFDTANDPNQPSSPVFFYGTVDRENKTLTGVKIFGSDGGGAGGEISAIEGNGAGFFFGPSFEFFDLEGVGNDYDVKDPVQSSTGSWIVGGNTFRDPHEAIDNVSPKGSANWQGFVVGVSEDMNAPHLNRAVFMNSDPTKFAFTVNKDNGTVTGSMTTMVDATGNSDYRINNLEIGTSGSSFVLEDALVALLGCSGNCVDDTVSINDTTLKPHGNYMVTENPENQFSKHLTWGYWEAAYTDLIDGTERHIHVPYSMWLAGVPSTSNVIKTGFTGVYKGKAVATRFFDDGSVTTVDYIKNGQFTLNANFDSNSITGSITLPGHTTLNLSSGSFNTPTTTSNSFTAIVNDSIDSTNGTLNGAFYGTNAEAVGGNFRSSISSTTSVEYVGIFGGDKQ